MDPSPPPVDPAPPELTAAPPGARGRKILGSLFAMTAVAPPVWAITFLATGQALLMVPWTWRLPENVLILLVPSLIALLVAWTLLRAGLRRDPPSRGQLTGWGIAAVASLGFLTFAGLEFRENRLRSRYKAMIPRQVAAACDQYALEHGGVKVFVRFEDLFGPDAYIKSRPSVDGEDLRLQFPVRHQWNQPATVRLPDGTTVQRTEVFAAVGRSGIVATFPNPQGDHYNSKRVYLLPDGTTFRNHRMVQLPPEPAGLEGRDQDGVHVYLLESGERYEITYRGGVPDGPFRAFRRDGSLWVEATYARGRVVGPAWHHLPDGRKFDELTVSADEMFRLYRQASTSPPK